MPKVSWFSHPNTDFCGGKKERKYCSLRNAQSTTVRISAKHISTTRVISKSIPYTNTTLFRLSLKVLTSSLVLHSNPGSNQKTQSGSGWIGFLIYVQVTKEAVFQLFQSLPGSVWMTLLKLQCGSLFVLCIV